MQGLSDWLGMVKVDLLMPFFLVYIGSRFLLGYTRMNLGKRGLAIIMDDLSNFLMSPSHFYSLA